ncbi:MAG TPA: hypothetical protein VMX77_00490 [Candidatus Bathyarchaeia archaeon]|nr:hypothetical protein [Candidatus Bathyarchaeia archaeon]
MSEVKQEQAPISIKEILGHYLIGGEEDKHQWKQRLALQARKKPDGEAAKLLEALQTRE